MASVEGATGSIGEEVHVGTRRSLAADSLEKSSEDGVAEAATLVLGQDRHVDDVEVPAAVAQDPAHADSASVALVDDVHSRPASFECGLRLIGPFRSQSRAIAQPQVVIHGRRAAHEAVPGRHLGHVHVLAGG
jgi:hypothetical protein